MNIGGLGQLRFVKISKDLPEEEKKKLTKLLRDFKDIFAWEYGEMPGLDPMMVSHKLNISPNVYLVKEPPRKYRPDVEEKIKHEIDKLLKAGFMEEIQCLK